MGFIMQPRKENEGRNLKETLSTLAQAGLSMHYLIAKVCERLERVGLMESKKFVDETQLSARAREKLTQYTDEGVSEVDLSNFELKEWQGLSRAIVGIHESWRTGGSRITQDQLDAILGAFVDLMIKTVNRLGKVESLMTTYEKEKLREELKRLGDMS